MPVDSVDKKSSTYLLFSFIYIQPSFFISLSTTLKFKNQLIEWFIYRLSIIGKVNKKFPYPC